MRGRRDMAVVMTACGSGAVWRSVWTNRRTLEYRASKPCVSTRSCQIAIALRPRSSARSISSRYGSHALALGARPGRGAAVSWWSVLADPSRWTPRRKLPVLTRQSRWTFGVVAGFGGQTRGRPPRRRMGMPAAFRYSLAVSRRMPVASSMRRNDQPSRPSAMTSCPRSRRCSCPARHHVHSSGVNVSVAYAWWPVFRCRSMADFGCLRGIPLLCFHRRRALATTASPPVPRRTRLEGSGTGCGSP